MPLPAGTRLGPYEILAKIGVGGMGEVYRATDTRLDRDVAIKVLPASLAGDPERIARFQREAKALVMELVEGPTLADRIAQGAIPVDFRKISTEAGQAQFRSRCPNGRQSVLSGAVLEDIPRRVARQRRQRPV